MADETDQKNERANKLRKAYGEATAQLREEKRERFDELYAEKAKALGVEYTPRLSPEQKAEQTFEALLEEYPHLREKVS